MKSAKLNIKYQMDSTQSKQSKNFYRMFMAGSTAILIAGPVILLLLIGLWLDGVLGTSPIFGLVGGLAGFGISIKSLLKFLKTTK